MPEFALFLELIPVFLAKTVCIPVVPSTTNASTWVIGRLRLMIVMRFWLLVVVHFSMYERLLMLLLLLLVPLLGWLLRSLRLKLLLRSLRLKLLIRSLRLELLLLLLWLVHFLLYKWLRLHRLWLLHPVLLLRLSLGLLGSPAGMMANWLFISCAVGFRVLNDVIVVIDVLWMVNVMLCLLMCLLLRLIFGYNWLLLLWQFLFALDRVNSWLLMWSLLLILWPQNLACSCSIIV